MRNAQTTSAAGSPVAAGKPPLGAGCSANSSSKSPARCGGDVVGRVFLVLSSDGVIRDLVRGKGRGRRFHGEERRTAGGGLEFSNESFFSDRCLRSSLCRERPLVPLRRAALIVFLVLIGCWPAKGGPAASSSAIQSRCSGQRGACHHHLRRRTAQRKEVFRVALWTQCHSPPWECCSPRLWSGAVAPAVQLH